MFFFLVVLLLGAGNIYAQGNVVDTGIGNTTAQPAAAVATNKDGGENIPSKKLAWAPIPKKAGLYAALLPGLGQIYNRQYWKIPIVYAGFAAGGYFIAKNTIDYNKYRKAYIGRVNNPYPTDEFVGVYEDPQLKQLQDDANRYLNLSVLFTTVGYAFQILDAVTAAHLRNFDISRDISMHVTPVAVPQGVGLGLVMNF